MPRVTRRAFLRLAATGAASTLLARPAVGQPSAEGSRLHLPRGYLLVQDLRTYHATQFGAISTAAEAEDLLASLEGRLDGLEFGSVFYDPNDLRAHEAVARVGVAHGVDLWMSTFGLAGKFRSFGEIRPELQAHVMERSGRIVPATVPGGGKSAGPLLDVLDPDAVDWFLTAFRARYLERMQGLLAGLFFNEDCIPYLGTMARHDRRFDYWRNATFSPAVLRQWREYCRAHDVEHGGRLLDRFPVHEPAMAARSGGRAMHVPGWNVPARVHAGDRFTSLPRARGVWKHWTDFTCALFLDNWIGPLAHLAREVNGGGSLWKGTLYFGLHSWSLPYEEIEDRRFRVPEVARWGAWGRQRGIDLEELAAHPEIDGIVCETYPPVAGNLEDFIAEFARITREAGKTFGLMLHRDDKWALKADEEQRRWDLIARYEPTILARYPRRLMTPGGDLYSAEAEALFSSRLSRYRRAGSPRPSAK